MEHLLWHHEMDATGDPLLQAVLRDLTWKVQRQERVVLPVRYLQTQIELARRARTLLSDENQIFLDRVLDHHLHRHGPTKSLRANELVRALRVCGEPSV